MGRARQDKSSKGSTVQLYTHTPTPDSSDPATAELLPALQAAALASQAGTGTVALSPAGKTAPGLPPTASAGSFVRVTGGGSGGGSSKLPAVLLSGFDTAFQGATFQTQFDTIDTVDADSIATAAVVLARAAHSLALGSSDSGSSGSGDGQERQKVQAQPQPPVDYAAVKATVEGLMQVSLIWQGRQAVGAGGRGR